MFSITQDNIIYYADQEKGVVVARFLHPSTEESKLKQKAQNCLTSYLLFDLERVSRIGGKNAGDYLYDNIAAAEGKAVCAAEDEFSLEVGMGLARKRLVYKSYKYFRRYLAQIAVKLNDLSAAVAELPCCPPKSLWPKSK